MSYARALCTGCYQFRGPTQFNGLSDECIPCQKRRAAWERGDTNRRGAHAEFSKQRRERIEGDQRRLDSARYRQYGLTEESHARLLEDCGNVCHICKRTNVSRSLAIDHDHATGEVRGLLCSNCNTGLGMFRDNPTLLRKAIAYLAEPPAQRSDLRATRR